MRKGMAGKGKFQGSVKCIGRASLKKVEPNLLQLLSSLRNTGVVVYDVSRLCRNTTNVDELLRMASVRGNWFMTVTEGIDTRTADGVRRLRQGVKSAQEESKTLGRRIAARIQATRAAGGHVGPAPYGYHKVRRDDNLFMLEEDGDEQGAIALINELLTTEDNPLRRAISLMRTAGSSFTDITDLLHEAGGLITESFFLYLHDEDGSKTDQAGGVIPSGFGTLGWSHIAKELNRFKVHGGKWTAHWVRAFASERLGEVVEELNRRGITYRGKPWTVALVKRVLKPSTEEASTFGCRALLDALTEDEDDGTATAVAAVAEALVEEVAEVPTRKRTLHAPSTFFSPEGLTLPRDGAATARGSLPRIPRSIVPAVAAPAWGSIPRVPSAPAPVALATVAEDDPMEVEQYERVWYQPGARLPRGIPVPPVAGWVMIPRSML